MSPGQLGGQDLGTKNKWLDSTVLAGFISKEPANWAVDPDDWSFITEDELNSSKDCDNNCGGDCDSECKKQDITHSNGEDPKKPLNNDGRDTCFKCGAQTVVKRGFHMKEYNICPRCGF